MKKTLSVLLALLIFAVSLPVAGVVASAGREGNFLYTLTDDGKKVIITDFVPTVGGAVTIPATIENKPVAIIGAEAFAACGLITGVTFPASVVTIGDNAFNGCASLKNLTLVNGLVSIGSAVFNGCGALVNVTVPKTVTSIGADAFDGCAALNAINVDPANATYSAEGGVLFNKAKTVLIKYPQARTLTTYAVPASVKEISPKAFYNAVKLNNITVADSVTTIGKQAFLYTGWYNAQPDGLVYAGKVAYKYKGVSMEPNTTITLADGTTGIAEDAFSGHANLVKIVIPASTVYIGASSFEGCVNADGTPSLTIHCEKDSYADKYAQSRGIPVSYNTTPGALARIFNKLLTLGRSMLGKLAAAFGTDIAKRLFQLFLQLVKAIIGKVTA